MAEFDPGKQRRFVKEFWTSAHELASLAITTLPGKRAPSHLNRLSFSAFPLSEFDKLPGGAEFLDRFEQIPHAVIRLGSIGLLAAFTAPYLKEEAHLLAPLSYNRLPPQLPLVVRALPCTFGRADIARLYTGHHDRAIASQHMAICAISSLMIVEDQGSKTGTHVITEIDDSLEASLPPQEIPDYMPPEWTDDMMPV